MCPIQYQSLLVLLYPPDGIFHALCHSTVFVGVCCSKYERMLAKLNTPILHSRRRHFDIVLLTNEFKNKIIFLPYFILLVYEYSLEKTNLHVWIITLPRSACQLDVSATTAIVRVTDIFNVDYITLTDIL
jgi:hypothetical protein